MIISSKAHYPKKRYRLKTPKEKQYESLPKDSSSPQPPLHPPVIVDEKKEYEFHIYTDGGFNQDHNIGSWSYMIKVKHGKKHFKLYKGGGTLFIHYHLPILMELKAVLEAIKYIASKKNSNRHNYTIKKITVYSDNKQVINSRLQYAKYKENDWKLLGSNNEMIEVLKKAWDEINEANEKYDVIYQWIPSHTGHPFNEYCDKACRSRIRNEIITRSIIAHNNFKL
jgi:ribonuclease HI